MRITGEKTFVTTLGRKGHIFTDTLLHTHKGLLQQDAEEAIEFGNGEEQLFQLALFDHDQLGIFQCIDGKKGGLPGVETVHIARPPIFESKLHDMLLAFVIDLVSSEATFIDKTFIPEHITGLQQVLFFAQGTYFQDRRKIVRLLGSQLNMPGNVFQDQLVHEIKVPQRNISLSRGPAPGWWKGPPEDILLTDLHVAREAGSLGTKLDLYSIPL